MAAERAFVSWSGGKDCSLACYRALRQGLDIGYLLNMVTGDSRQSRSHGVAAEWLRLQSQAIGIPLLQKAVVTDYESDFKTALASLKSEGISAGVFGDIDFNAHREWIDRVCAESGITPYYPLWEEDQDGLMREFIGAGFVSRVVSVKMGVLGEEWLGRLVDGAFLDELERLPGITPCGEAGEYHTLVLDGPFFKQRLEITETARTTGDDHWFLDIKNCVLAPKK